MTGGGRWGETAMKVLIDSSNSADALSSVDVQFKWDANLLEVAEGGLDFFGIADGITFGPNILTFPTFVNLGKDGFYSFCFTMVHEAQHIILDRKQWLFHVDPSKPDYDHNCVQGGRPKDVDLDLYNDCWENTFDPRDGFFKVREAGVIDLGGGNK